MSNTFLIARREFLTRVQKKTFLLTTILLPLLIFGFYALIIYFSVKTGDHIQIAIVDNAKLMTNINDKQNGDIQFNVVQNVTPSELDYIVQKKQITGYIVIPENYTIMGFDTLSLKSDKSIRILTRD
jgi:ABC-2 type transport system permease protein